MTTSQTSEFILHLRRAVLLRDGAILTDGQLLEDYLSRREEAALAALVHRHAPMVWGVCRRVLRTHHDAEDAFQATFVVLVRKAGSIVPRQMVANWLYGVAYQTALNARATAAKRNGRERKVTKMPEPAVADQDLWHDLQPLLDEELSRLPDKYRAVVVLCDLEGKTRKESALQLGVPEGTVAGWLARARTMLAKRLAQRGVVLSGGALAAVVSQKVASAGVPPTVVSSTIKAASLLAAGRAAGVVTSKVAALADGVMKTMLTTKIKSVLAVVLLFGLILGGIGAGVGFSTHSAAVAQQPKAKPDYGKKNDDKAALAGLQPKQVGKAGKEERKVLTPEEAIKQMPKENVTVQFKVASVETNANYRGYFISPLIYLKDGGKSFTACLYPSKDGDQLQKLVKKLGIESVDDLSGKVVRVTGRADGVIMYVRDPANSIEIVKE